MNGVVGVDNFWSNGLTTDSITVNYTGTYFCQSTDTNRCSNRDTIHVTLNSVFEPRISWDIPACDSVILDCGSPNSTYYWFDANSDTLGNSRY